jgi:hypothetical protein
MRLSAEQIKGIADFSEDEDCFISAPQKGRLGDEIVTAVIVTRIDGMRERVRIFENGMIEAFPNG